MEFEDYEHSYFPKRWDYLDGGSPDAIYSVIQLNSYIWKMGNGTWEGYNVSTEDIYWDENLIFNI